MAKPLQETLAAALKRARYLLALWHRYQSTADEHELVAYNAEVDGQLKLLLEDLETANARAEKDRRARGELQ